MYKFIKKYPAKYNLIHQLHKYILSTCITRSGGVTYSLCFPFEKDVKGARIAICGAGTFGQQLEKRLIEEKYCEVVAWVDYDYWEYRRCCLNVDPLEALLKVKFDYVLLGTVDSLATQKMREQLVLMGIKTTKILSVQTNDKMIEKTLSHYLTLNESEKI